MSLSEHGVDVLVAISESELYDPSRPERMIPFAAVREGLHFTMIRSLGGVVSALVREGLVRVDGRGGIAPTAAGAKLIAGMDPEVRL